MLTYIKFTFYYAQFSCHIDVMDKIDVKAFSYENLLSIGEREKKREYTYSTEQVSLLWVILPAVSVKLMLVDAGAADPLQPSIVPHPRVFLYFQNNSNFI